MKYECLIFTISILILSTSCKKKEDAIPEINVKRNNSTQERKENLDKNEVNARLKQFKALTQFDIRL